MPPPRRPPAAAPPSAPLPRRLLCLSCARSFSLQLHHGVRAGRPPHAGGVRHAGRGQGMWRSSSSCRGALHRVSSPERILTRAPDAANTVESWAFSSLPDSPARTHARTCWFAARSHKCRARPWWACGHVTPLFLQLKSARPPSCRCVCVCVCCVVVVGRVRADFYARCQRRPPPAAPYGGGTFYVMSGGRLHGPAVYTTTRC
jgi:hypothetical protein